MVKVGVGFARDLQSSELGVKAGKEALANGELKKSELKFILAFCTNEVNYESFFKGIQSIVGKNVPIIGGAAVGVITNKNLLYCKKVGAVAFIESNDMDIAVNFANGLKDSEFEAGKKLLAGVKDLEAKKLYLLFYDSIKFCASPKAPPVLNASLPLLNGLRSKINNGTPVIGAGLTGDFDLGKAKLFCGDTVKDDCAVMAMLGGTFNYYSTIMHGCTPKDGVYHTITKMSGQFIYEVDNRPIVEVINEAYGNEDWQMQNPVGTLTIGVNHGGKYSDYSEGNYVNRLICGVLPDKSGIVLFEPDLSEGTEFQFMLRDSIRIIDTTKKETEKLLLKIEEDGQRPVFAFYIDCAGRTIYLSNNIKEEASEVQDVLNIHNVPLLGFYSGVEIAPLLGESRGLDWTGVLLIFTENYCD